jgi:hypothetical protein
MEILVKEMDGLSVGLPDPGLRQRQISVHQFDNCHFGGIQIDQSPVHQIDNCCIAAGPLNSPVDYRVTPLLAFKACHPPRT